MRSFYLTAFIFLFFSYSVSAQKGFYEKAYIIQSQDTIHGFIERLSNEELSHKIKFKLDLNSVQEKEYFPNNIIAFGFEKEKVHFSTVEVEIRKDTLSSKTQRFAKILALGHINLYKLELPMVDRLVFLKPNNLYVYVIKKDDIFFTLGQYEYQRETKVGLLKRYLGQLNIIASDCPQSRSHTEKTPFSDKAMLQFVKKYNTCKAPDQKLITFSPKIKPIVSQGPEISLVKLDLNENEGNLFEIRSYGAGYFWDISKPENSTKLSTFTAINLQMTKYNYSYDSSYLVINSSESYYESVTINKKAIIHALRLPIFLQYNIKSTKNPLFQPFVNAGVSAYLQAFNYFESTKFNFLITYGGGLYLKNLRFSVAVQNSGIPVLTDNNNLYINFTLGYRINKLEK